MKKKSLIISLAAGALLCACSSDELAISGSEQKVFEGDKAYVTVSISDVGSSTRATTSGFQNSLQTERTVGNAYFYFYDEDGVFVSEGEVWEGGNNVGGDGNIEYESNTVIILKGLTGMNYPKYVVTVLNRPKDFSVPETLDEMKTKLANDDEVGIQDASGNFTITTTSYFSDPDNPDTERYFVTELDESNFSTEPIADDLTTIDPVEIYVERLAVKVTVGTDLGEADKTLGDGTELYKIEETIAGDGNVEDDDADPGIASEEIYVALLGWKLNATARHTYLMKNIDSSWTDDDLNFDWNDEGNERSYWGMSYNYGLTDSDYPTSADGQTAAGEDDEATSLNKYLKYVNLEDTDDSPLKSMGDFDYCAENTNTAGEDGIIQNMKSSAITSVLVKAMVCDADGNGLDLVRYNGLLYTQEHFKEYILNHIQNSPEGLNYWYDTETQDEQGNEIYSQIDASYVELDDADNGQVNIKLTDEVVGTVYQLVPKYNVETHEFEDKYVVLTEDDDLTIYETDGIGYKGGLMYYDIPIQHLNDDYENGLQEANYGVVRNHHYVLTINKLENVGKGIFNPDEVIVPDDNEDETYYVGANIKILSWKIVEQTVGL